MGASVLYVCVLLGCDVRAACLLLVWILYEGIKGVRFTVN